MRQALSGQCQRHYCKVTAQTIGISYPPFDRTSAEEGVPGTRRLAARTAIENVFLQRRRAARWSCRSQLGGPTTLATDRSLRHRAAPYWRSRRDQPRGTTCMAAVSTNLLRSLTVKLAASGESKLAVRGWPSTGNPDWLLTPSVAGRGWSWAVVGVQFGYLIHSQDHHSSATDYTWTRSNGVIADIP